MQHAYRVATTGVRQITVYVTCGGGATVRELRTVGWDGWRCIDRLALSSLHLRLDRYQSGLRESFRDRGITHSSVHSNAS